MFGSPLVYIFAFQCSSASRKFLNNAVVMAQAIVDFVSVLFSEPKIPQSALLAFIHTDAARFSALQRAENSSIDDTLTVIDIKTVFQCSSASRKFLNPVAVVAWRADDDVSVLFSEPKIPQSR